MPGRLRVFLLVFSLTACGMREPAARPTCSDPPSRAAAPAPSGMPSGPFMGTAGLIPGETLIYDHGQFTARDRIVEAADVDEALAARVIDASFPHHLKRVCPKIPGEARAGTWVDLDHLQEKADRAGLLRPRVLQRVDGHFTSPVLWEALFTIDFGHCVSNGGVDTLYVVFDASKLGDKKLVPRARVQIGEWHAHSLVGVVERDNRDVLLARSCCSGDTGLFTLRLERDEEAQRWSFTREENGNMPIDPRCSIVMNDASKPFKLYRAACND